ncbi:MAG: hypothetical protein WCV62_03335 [Candidatus Peribacteraceae bacterium]|jgi:hypothetical protein
MASLSPDQLRPQQDPPPDARLDAFRLPEDLRNKRALEREQAGNQTADRRARMNVKMLFAQREKVLKETFSTAEMQNALDAATEDLLRQMEQSEDKFFKERITNLKQIRKLAAPKEKRPFDLMSLSMGINYELEEIRKALEGGIYAPGEPAFQTLRNEQSFLENLLGQIGVDRKMMQQYLDPFPKDEHRKKLDKDVSQMGRVHMVLVGGAMALLTGVVAYLANRKSPNFNSSLVWLFPTVIGVMGMERFTASRGDSIRKEYSFMDENSSFIAYASKFPGQLEQAASQLMKKENAKEARHLVGILKEKSKKGSETPEEWEQRKIAAREDIKRLLNPNRGTTGGQLSPSLEDAMLLDERGFVRFALPLIDSPLSTETQQVVLRYLRDGIMPRELYKTPPSDIAASGGIPSVTPPLSS